MKLRATLTIDFTAKDFMDAARHQQELDSIAKDLANKYDSVEFDIRERRDFKGSTTKKKQRQHKLT